ncbi:NCS2 family permease [Clostridium isatidis]|uniref:Permease n=1 Tax=Clostridium isatidis TaxID=182773 RepID=A0A343JB40_9CLOT|nr:NCS2 family permease [Clostridium isatidis]ASW42748.1 permease [Clostridium isatidis]
MERLFNFTKHKTSLKTELIAGLTSFFSAVYIIVVNASILSDGGVKQEPLIIATILASFIGCLLAAFVSNAPLIIMPGMGINALFTYTIIHTLGLNFNQALTSVFTAGVLFLIIASTKLSKILDKAIPKSLKESISVGIGFFITFLGLQKSGLIAADPSTFVKIQSFNNPRIVFFIIIFIITLILFVKNIPGAFLISIIVATISSIMLGLTELNISGFSLPNFKEYSSIFFKLDFTNFFTSQFWIATFSFTLILVFENIGILHGQMTGLLNAPEKQNKSLVAVALSTIACGLLGTSPSVSTVEGTAGISAGGKTGFTAIVTAFLILTSMLFIPFLTLIPDEAIAPILIILGSLMVKSIKEIDLEDISEGIPAFLTIALIPLTFSIIDGIAFGFISYTLIKLIVKKKEEISIPMYIISITFIIYFLLSAL